MTVLQEVHLGEEELLSWMCQVFKFWLLQCQGSILLRLLDPGDKHTAFIGNVRNYSTNNKHHTKEDLYFPQHYHQNVTLLMLGFTLTFSRKNETRDDNDNDDDDCRNENNHHHHNHLQHQVTT